MAKNQEAPQRGSNDSSNEDRTSARTAADTSGTFTNDIEKQRESVSRECRDIAGWIEQTTGIKPTEVKPSPAWLGEDRQIGVQVFHAVAVQNPDEAEHGVRDWWVVVERSGDRFLYPAMLSTAGDSVKYHRQVRSAEMKSK